MFADVAPVAPFTLTLPTPQHRAAILGIGPSGRRTRLLPGTPVVFPLIEARGEGTLILARLDVSPPKSAITVPSEPIVLALEQVQLTVDACSFDSALGFVSLPLHAVAAVGTQGGGPTLTVSSCRFGGCTTGVLAERTTDLVVQDSAFEECLVGLRIDSVPTSVTANSAFADCGIGQLTTFDLPFSPLANVAVRHALRDCRFDDCEIGLDFDYLAEPSWAPEPIARVERCQFSAPTDWRWVPTAESGRPSGAVGPEIVGVMQGLRSESGVIRTGLRVRFGRPTSASGYFAVQRCLFDLLELGLVARPGPRPAVFVDHNTFVAHREAAVRVGGDHRAWSGNPTVRSGLRTVSTPGMVITNNVFEGVTHHDGRSDPLYGAIEFVAPWPTGGAGNPPSPVGEAVVIAANFFRGFWRTRNLVFSRSGTLTADHFGPGHHWHRLTPWENRVGSDPVLARLPEVGSLAIDVHPVVSLGSPLLAASLSGQPLALVGSWGYPTDPGDGYYTNEQPDAGPSVGAAEPAGWREFPLFIDGVGTSYGVAAPLCDIVLQGGTLNANRAGQPALTGQPSADAWTLFRGDDLVAAAASARSLGVKLAARLPMHGGEAFDVRGTPHGFPAPAGQQWAPSGPPFFNEFPAEVSSEFDVFGGFRTYWVGAAVAFLDQLRNHPDAVATIAYIWGPEEPTPNIYLAGTGGYPRQYGASLLLRQALNKGHPEYRFLTYQDNAHGVATTLPANQVGWAATVAASPAAMVYGPTMMVVGPYSLDLEPPPYLWGVPYGLGQEELASGARSPGRPSSAYRDPAVDLDLTTPPPSAREAGYHTNEPALGTPVVPDPNLRAYPAVDELDFLAPVFEGLLVGVYWQRLQGALRFAAQPNVPSLTDNRLIVRQRTRGLLESAANAEFLARQRSQTTGRTPTVLGLELVHGYDDDAGLYRVSPRNSAFAAHDLLLGLFEATGLFLWGLTYRGGVDAAQDWYDWGNQAIPHGPNDTLHPGWEGYRAIFELLKRELREFLVFGDREFDLGFEIVSPTSGQEVAGAYWGPRVGFVQDWQRTNHLILRARDRVYLIVTRSQTEVTLTVTNFVFGHSSLAGATSTTLWPASGTTQSSATPDWLFEDSISGIGARVYRIDLPT